MPIAVRALVLKYLPLALVWALSICIAVAATWRLARTPAASGPADTGALIAAVRPLGWHGVAESPTACYVYQGETAPALPSHLLRDDGHVADWHGVVWCGREQAGEGVRVGRWLLFGDPAMVARMRELPAH